MKKILVAISVLFFVLFLAGCKQKQTNQPPHQPLQIMLNPTDKQIPINSSTPKQQECAIDFKQCPNGKQVTNNNPDCSFEECENYDLSKLDPSLWTKYTNNRLGFSIMIPKFVVVGEKDNNKAPVKVTEKDNTVKIYVEGFENENNEAWTIKIGKVKNDEDINTFINNHTGREGCKVYRKDPSLQAGVYEVTIKPDPENTENPCSGMSAYVLKYFPEKGLIAYWELGQDNNFSIPLNKEVVITDKDGNKILQIEEGADEIMAASFEFLK